MTSALYLENYLDGLEHLPAELRRNFNLMRELDNRVQTLMKTIDKECNDFMKNTSSDTAPPVSEDGRRDKLKAIQDMFNKTKQLGDDKVQLAIQTYELVDKHIRRLDADLQRFEGEIQDKNPTGPPEENVAKSKWRGCDPWSISINILSFQKRDARREKQRPSRQGRRSGQ